MNTREKAQELVELGEKATAAEWLISSGDEESQDEIYVYDDPSLIEEYPSYTTVAEGLLQVDSSFIAKARSNAPDIARKLIKALDVLETIAAYADVTAWPDGYDLSARTAAKRATDDAHGFLASLEMGDADNG